MTRAHQLVHALLAGEVRLENVAPEAAAELLEELGPLVGRLAARAVQTPAPAPSAATAGERMLTIAEVAERLRKSPRWVRDNWRVELPFARKVGKTILFPQSGLERHLRR